MGIFIHTVMKNKIERLGLIKRIVAERHIGNQDDLLKALSEHDINMTQATLSRDLKALKIVRSVTEDGSYRYVLPGGKNLPEPGFALNFTGDGSLEFSGNLAVMKTRAGYAGAIASEIDRIADHSILGTLAGDDTILIILRENSDRAAVKSLLESLKNEA